MSAPEIEPNSPEDVAWINAVMAMSFDELDELAQLEDAYEADDEGEL